MVTPYSMTPFITREQGETAALEAGMVPDDTTVVKKRQRTTTHTTIVSKPHEKEGNRRDDYGNQQHRSSLPANTDFYRRFLAGTRFWRCDYSTGACLPTSACKNNDDKQNR